jgi:hypothetical protein
MSIAAGEYCKVSRLTDQILRCGLRSSAVGSVVTTNLFSGDIVTTQRASKPSANVGACSFRKVLVIPGIGIFCFPSRKLFRRIASRRDVAKKYATTRKPATRAGSTYRARSLGNGFVLSITNGCLPCKQAASRSCSRCRVRNISRLMRTWVSRRCWR